MLHELAHARMARLRGYRLSQIVLMPYGAVLKGGEHFPRLDTLLIAVAGPLVNLILALIIVALWWLVPDLYTATEPLMWSNLSLALFNLLPVFPLDGARIILACSNSKGKTLMRLRIVGIILAILLLVLMIVSFFYTFNISLGIASIFVMHGALSGTERELYTHIMSVDNFSKSTIDAITYLDIGISIDACLYKLLEKVRSDRIVTFHVLDERLEEVCNLEEDEVRDMILTHTLSTTLREALSENSIM